MITFMPLLYHILNQRKIVITGGPSTGKTSVVINLEKKGYTCVHELIRSMTSKEKNGGNSGTLVTNPIVYVKDPKKFNQQLLEGRIAQYKNIPSSEMNVIFFDRGIPDVHAYMDCFGQNYDAEFERPCYDYRYDQVLLMPPWLEIHEVDNERLESFEESARIYQCLKKAYTDFGYSVTLIPKGSIEERTTFILDLLNLT